MPKYVIEREIPGAGNLSGEDLQGVSQTSCNVLNQLGTQISMGAELRYKRQNLLRLYRA